MKTLRQVWQRVRGDMALGTFLASALTGSGIGIGVHGVHDMRAASETFAAAEARGMLYCGDLSKTSFSDVEDPRCTINNLDELRAVRQNAGLRYEFGRQQLHASFAFSLVGTVILGVLRRRKNTPESPKTP